MIRKLRLWASNLKCSVSIRSNFCDSVKPSIHIDRVSANTPHVSDSALSVTVLSNSQQYKVKNEWSFILLVPVNNKNTSIATLINSLHFEDFNSISNLAVHHTLCLIPSRVLVESDQLLIGYDAENFRIHFCEVIAEHHRGFEKAVNSEIGLLLSRR